MKAHERGSHDGGGDDPLVCCVVGNERYAVRGADVQRVIRAEAMQPERGANGRVGTLGGGRDPVPVYPLAARLGRSTASTGTHIMVTSGACEPVGWLVDRVVRMPRARGTRVLPLPSVVGPVPAAWFEGLLTIDDLPCLLLSPSGADPCADVPAFRPAPAPAPVRAARTAAAAGMVVLFSSPALPPCDAPRVALSARQVAAVVPSLMAIPVPGSPPHVRGVARWRDTAVPVVDFRENGRSASRTRYLVARGGARLQGAMVAFAIDADVALHRAEEQDREVGGDVPRPGFLVGRFAIGAEPVALLDLDALVMTQVDH